VHVLSAFSELATLCMSFQPCPFSLFSLWEQELRPPSPLACRLMSEIEAEPAHWRKRLAACLVTH
jgi:hypothetical protein